MTANTSSPSHLRPVRSARAAAVAALAAGALALSACGGDDPPPPLPEVAGDYSFFLTNGENGCNFPDWNVGESLVGVPAAVTRIGDNAVATFDGEVGLFLDEQANNREFAGTLSDEPVVELLMEGNRFFLEGNCSFRFLGTLTGEYIEDFITGEIRYVGETNNNPGCELIEGCVSRQSFNATKPPAAPDGSDPSPPDDAGAADAGVDAG